ncbi:MAG: phosphatase PAP2 family protein [Tissierellia bacterium]|nr:phosphatase PAP2 family protein [Tissierellia bacterium]
MNWSTNSRYRIFLLVIISVIFFILGIMVRGSNEGVLFDHVILEYIHNNINPLLIRIMKFISFIGSAYFIISIMAIIIAYNNKGKKYYESKLLLLSTAGSWTFNFLLKQVFRRVRPLDYFLVDQGGFSYPSGHTMVATTFYFTIAYLLTRNMKDKDKRVFYLMATIAILLMGISRIYLGVHWPTDILGGFLMGYVFYNLSLILSKEEE